jgi:hypothetical protein
MRVSQHREANAIGRISPSTDKNLSPVDFDFIGMIFILVFRLSFLISAVVADHEKETLADSREHQEKS